MFILVLFLPGFWLSEADAAERQFLSLKDVAQQHGIRVGVIDDNCGSANFVNTIRWGFDSVTPGSRMEFQNIHPCPPS
jgi:hypothetical protein